MATGKQRVAATLRLQPFVDGQKIAEQPRKAQRVRVRFADGCRFSLTAQVERNDVHAFAERVQERPIGPGGETVRVAPEQDRAAGGTIETVHRDPRPVA